MDWLLECTVPLWLYIEAWWARPLAQSSFRIWILRSWMKKCDHSDSPSTGQRQCLTRATRLQLMATVFQVVESFPYLGCLIRCTGDNVLEIKRRVSITRDCMMALDRNIWRSCISVGTKLRLYNSCFLPIFLYGAETWSVTATAVKTFDALDQWCLRPHPEYTLDRAHHQQGVSIKNPTTITVWRSPLQTPSLLWSHLQSWPQSGSFSALYASTTGLPKHWRRPGRPRQTWLRTIENDLRPLPVSEMTYTVSSGTLNPSIPFYGHSIWIRWQLNGVRRTEQLGSHSWKRQRRRQAPDDDDDYASSVPGLAMPIRESNALKRLDSLFLV